MALFIVFTIITVATKISIKLSGIANAIKLYGNIPRFPITSHISTNTITHDRKVVCNNVNFLVIK